ncbi:unnamed protein product [Prunus armeniaca]
MKFCLIFLYISNCRLELLFWVGHHEITGMVDTSIAGMEDASVASFVCSSDRRSAWIRKY